MKRTLVTMTVVGLVLFTAPLAVPQPQATPPPFQEPPVPPNVERENGVIQVGRNDPDLYGKARAEFAKSQDARAKMRPMFARQFDEASDKGPFQIVVYTEGEPVRFKRPVEKGVDQGEVSTNLTTQEELERLNEIGTVVHVGEASAWVQMEVPNKGAIRRVATLDFVFSIQMPAKVQQLQTYSTAWVDTNEKITNSRISRNADDGAGDGRIPDNVWTAIIDTGYDGSESRYFGTPAHDQIHHCHGYSGMIESTWTRPTGQVGGNIGTACGAANEDNSHGTMVADKLADHNWQGGKFHVYNFGATNTFGIVAAYDHLLANHGGIDVISSSLVLVTPTNHGRNCASYFDSTLQALVSSPSKILISTPEANPDSDHDATPTIQWDDYSLYPSDSTWAFAVVGVRDGNPWPVDAWMPNGNIQLSVANCPLQYAYHDARDRDFSIFKPDVFGFYLHRVHVAGGICANNDAFIVCGNSMAQPEIASGLNTLMSRYYVGNDANRPLWKQWDATRQCWEESAKLIWASNAPDGRGVQFPTLRDPQLGRLADHDAWYLDPRPC